MPDRILTISLRKYLSSQPRNKRTRKAVRYVRERIAHYNKVDEENVRISTDLNSRIIKNYSKNMSPIKLVVNVDKGIAMASDFNAKKEAPKVAEKKAAQPARAEKATASTTPSKPKQQEKAQEPAKKKEVTTTTAQKESGK
jgi:ribosomal protein L31E